MRAVIQRVSSASIDISGSPSGSMNVGLVVLLGVGSEDAKSDAEWLSKKVMNLRIFEDDGAKMNRSIEDIGGSLLIVSQFTLFGNLKKGTRPSFNRSALPDQALPLYEDFVENCRIHLGKDHVITGEFGAHMDVQLINDGPVTLVLDSKQRDF